MMKADISIVQSKKGTEIMVSGNKINKYGILAEIGRASCRERV